MGLVILLTLSLSACSFAWNNPLILQVFTALSIFLGIIFLILGAVEFANGSGSSNSTKVAGISLALTLALSLQAFAAFRLHHLEENTEKRTGAPEEVIATV